MEGNYDWYIKYKSQTFDLDDYVRMSYNKNTEKFVFVYIGPHDCNLEFVLSEFRTERTDTSFNYVMAWLGAETDVWRCGSDHPLFIMPRNTTLFNRYSFFALYLDIIERPIRVGDRDNYSELACTFVPTGTKTSHIFSENVSPIKVNTNMSYCTVTLCDAYDQLVNFYSKTDVTTIVLELA